MSAIIPKSDAANRAPKGKGEKTLTKKQSVGFRGMANVSKKPSIFQKKKQWQNHGKGPSRQSLGQAEMWDLVEGEVAGKENK